MALREHECPPDQCDLEAADFLIEVQTLFEVRHGRLVQRLQSPLQLHCQLLQQSELGPRGSQRLGMVF